MLIPVMINDPIWSAWLGAGVMCALAVGLALIIRLGRGPGAGVLGGVLAGLLLGPSILGAAYPGQYEAWFVGGAEARRNLEVQQAMYDGAAVGRAPIEPDEQRLSALRDELEQARAAHEAPLRWTVSITAALVLLIGASRIRPFAMRHWLSAASIGVWAALLPAGLGWLALRFLWDQPVEACSTVAAALAIGPWALNRDDRTSADDAEIGGARLIAAAGRISTVVAFGFLAHAMIVGEMHARAVALWPLAAVLIGWALPRVISARLRDELRFACVAILAGALAVRIDLYSHLNLWLILLFMVLSGDGRWIGAWLGALTLGGRAGLRTLRMVLGSMAAGPTQLAAAALLLHTGVIAAEYASALLAGALLIELFAPVRRRVAQHIRETETELERMREEDEN